MILVTGGSGFIGKSLVAKLVDNDYNVRILTRSTGKVNRKVNVVLGDILKKETLKKAMKDIDTVIHLAGLISYSRNKEMLYKVNVKGTKNLLEFSKNVEKFIFSSSVSVIGPVKGIADEKYPCSPLNEYGISKLRAEEAIRDYGVNSVILRLAPVYGTGSQYWMKNLRMLEKGFPIPNTKNLTHILHVSDAVDAFLHSIERGKGIYLIADKEPIPFVELAKKMLNLLGKTPKIWPAWTVRLMSLILGKKKYIDVLTMNRNYSIEKAKRELKYIPKADMDKELKNMIKWYKEHKHVQHT